ncbi:MAG TPA: hypothetical protein VGM19_06585 [Armatimonadota bacterium]|jgi:hypothetical protein
MARDYLARYHESVVCALPADEVEKFRIKLGGNLLQPFIDQLGGEKLTREELSDRLAGYLRDELGMAESVEVRAEGDEIAVDIRGCHLCFGNDRLRAREMKGCCPFAPGVNRALSKALGGGAHLEGVSKPSGQTGECIIKYTAGG